MAGTYIVLIQEDYIRDAQVFDPSGMSFEEFDDLDMYDENNESRWQDISPSHYVGHTQAESNRDAIKKIAKESGYDPRILEAIKI